MGHIKFSRITVNPHQDSKVPCIRSLRIPVAPVVGRVANKMSEEETCRTLPDLEPDGILEALHYAADAAGTTITASTLGL